MKRVVFAATFAACVSVSGAAFGADIMHRGTDVSFKDAPISENLPAAIWSGLYIGGHIGGSTSDTDISDTYTYNTVDPHTNTNISNDGLLAGGQIGYNFQRGHVVYGVEADIGRMNISGDGSAHLLDEGKSGQGFNHKCDGHHSDSPNNDQHCALDAKYSVSGGLYGDITGRLGYANGKTLFYAKGGAAFLNVDADAHYKGQNFTGKASPFDFSQSETLWGWTVGAGVEHALSSSWSIKAEYQHFDFGTMQMDYDGVHTFCCNGSGKSTLSGTSETDVTADAISLGLNYHIGGDRGALK